MIVLFAQRRKRGIHVGNVERAGVSLGAFLTTRSGNCLEAGYVSAPQGEVASRSCIVTGERAAKFTRCPNYESVDAPGRGWARHGVIVVRHSAAFGQETPRVNNLSKGAFSIHSGLDCKHGKSALAFGGIATRSNQSNLFDCRALQ